MKTADQKLAAGASPENGAGDLQSISGKPERPRLTAADCYVVVVDDNFTLGGMHAEILSMRAGGAKFIHAGDQNLAQLAADAVSAFQAPEARGKQLILLTDRDLEKGRVGEDVIFEVMRAMPSSDVRGIVISGLVSKANLAGDHNHLSELAHVRGVVGKPSQIPDILEMIERVAQPATPPI